MRNGNRMVKMLTALLAVVVMMGCAVSAQAEDGAPYDGNLRIEDGTLLPMCIPTPEIVLYYSHKFIGLKF